MRGPFEKSVPIAAAQGLLGLSNGAGAAAGHAAGYSAAPPAAGAAAPAARRARAHVRAAIELRRLTRTLALAACQMRLLIVAAAACAWGVALAQETAPTGLMADLQHSYPGQC